MPETIEITKIKENYNNREYVLKAVSEQGTLLDFADDSFKADKEIVLTAIENKGIIVKYASKRLREDKDIKIEAIKQNKR